MSFCSAGDTLLSNTVLRCTWFFALFLATLYNHAVGFGGSPLMAQVWAAVTKVSLARSSAVSTWSNPKWRQSTETILRYSVRNKCGMISCCDINQIIILSGLCG